MLQKLIKAVIIEDEPLAREKLTSFIQRVDKIEVLSSFSDGLSAISFLQNNEVDLIFLDIEIPGCTGLEVLESMKTLPNVIITSAYEQYALKGYEFNVTDYLLKPYSFERFQKAIDKIKLSTLEEPNSIDHTDNDYLLVKTEYRIERIPFSSIMYIEGMKDYLRIHTDEKRVMTLKSFISIASELPIEKFIRIHRSYMVAVNRITAIEKNTLYLGSIQLPIGKSYKEHLLKSVHIHPATK